nr:hypothetical protein BaRGS_022977 [Batillaria attramentaria]
MGGRYSLHGFVKLLDENPDKLWQAFKAIIKFSFNDTSLGVGNYIIAYRGFATAADGWITLVGNLNAPMKDFYTAQLSIRGPEAGLTFLIDNVALREVPEHPDWEATAHTNIDTHRKSNVQFQITLPEGVKANHIDIQIDHKKHLFAFGSKIEDHLARETQYEAFRSLFFYLFNWATIGSYKWRFDKGTPENPDFSEAVEATNVLLENGLKVRGHSILWGFEKNIPDWVLQVDKSQLQDVVDDHVKYMMNLAKGKLAQWDVQNEFIHGHYYEEKLHDPNVTINAFKLARSLDPVPKLYLNDFQSVTTGASTEKRLDRLAETGLELFMTEFDLGWDDDLERADWYEDTIRAFFAHPGLSGDYEVIVRNRGVPVQVETFFLGKTDTTVNITITTGKGIE